MTEFEFRKPRSSRAWQVSTVIDGEHRLLGGVWRDKESDNWLAEVRYLGNPEQPASEFIIVGAVDRTTAAEGLLVAYQSAVEKYLVPQRIEIPQSKQFTRDLGRDALIALLKEADKIGDYTDMADCLIAQRDEVISVLALATTKDA